MQWMTEKTTYRNINTTMTERMTIMKARMTNIRVKITARTTSRVPVPVAAEEEREAGLLVEISE